MTARPPEPVRLTFAPEIRDDVNGAWWPYSASMARELPQLIQALGERVGEVVDISVNWSSLDRVPDLDQLSRRGAIPLPGQETRHHRVMSVTGTTAQANLLIVPSDTTKGLAVMVLRRAADLPVRPMHQDTDAYRTAETIVRAARAQRAAGITPADSSH